MAKVLVIGATGYLGHFVTLQLAQAGVQTTALVRPLKDGNEQRQAKVDDLRSSGVTILEESLDVDIAQLSELLKSFDTVVSLLQGVQNTLDVEVKLIEASKQAGIRRFFPAWWGGEYPTEGEHANPLTTAGFNFKLAPKKHVIEVLKSSGVPYTIVVTYAFFRWMLPCLGFALPGSPLTFPVKVFGRGNTPARATAEEDIGRVVARAVNDPRTANTKLVIHAAAPTQNELIAIHEASTGQTVPCTTVTNEELTQQLQDAEGVRAWILSIQKATWLDHVAAIPPEYFTSDAVVYAHKLYPDLKFCSVEDFYRSQHVSDPAAA